MIEATIESIRVSLVTQNRVVILRELGGTRQLPIWIGSYEAEAIALELQGVSPTRPLPYDLMRTLIDELNAEVDRVIITDLNAKVYYATIVLSHGERTIEIDARPSDALALAIRSECRVLIAESVMDSAGVVIQDDTTIEQTESDTVVPGSGGNAAPEESTPSGDLGVFRDFINSLDLEDFDKDSKG